MKAELTPDQRLVRIETIVENLDKKFDGFLEGYQRDHKDHEDRIRKLEHRQWWFAGAAAVIGAFGRELLRVLAGG